MTQLTAETAVSRKNYAVIPKHDPQVTMSNALVRAGHGLTLAEKRIVMLAVSKMNSRAPVPPATSLPRTKITAAEYAEIAKCGMPTAYEALQDAAKHLFERKITFLSPPTHGLASRLNPSAMTCDGWDNADTMRMKAGLN